MLPKTCPDRCDSKVCGGDYHEEKDMMQLAAGGVAFTLLIALAGFLCIALVVAAVRSVILSNV